MRVGQASNPRLIGEGLHKPNPRLKGEGRSEASLTSRSENARRDGRGLAGAGLARRGGAFLEIVSRGHDTAGEEKLEEKRIFEKKKEEVEKKMHPNPFFIG